LATGRAAGDGAGGGAATAPVQLVLLLPPQVEAPVDAFPAKAAGVHKRPRSRMGSNTPSAARRLLWLNTSVSMAQNYISSILQQSMFYSIWCVVADLSMSIFR
jgi:hypothetical protein